MKKAALYTASFSGMKRSVHIIGSGPAALMLAAQLDETRFDVTIYEKNFAVARKFLVAGDGGFNLTHSENTDRFILRYTPAAFFEKFLHSFDSNDLRDWLKEIGIETYVGTSKRVFPVKGIKPIDVLNAVLKELKRKGVAIKTQQIWKGWNEKGELLFENGGDQIAVKPDITVLALGGASWPKTGSDGSWIKLLEEKNITIIPFRSSNCAYAVQWPAELLKAAEGKSLKNIALSCDDQTKNGEIVITQFGLEGGAVYALSPQIREQLRKDKAEIYIDLKPVFSEEEILKRLSAKGNRSYTKLLQDELSFNEAHLALLKALLTKEEFTNTDLIAKKMKRLPVTITGAAPIAEAISTVGGIALTEVNESLELKKLPSVYAIGEMLDWDAPTGGYLLQGCFSMGDWVAKKLNGFKM